MHFPSKIFNLINIVTSSKSLKYKKKIIKRIIIVICSSLLIISIVIIIFPRKSYAYPSLSLDRLKSIIKNLTKEKTPTITNSKKLKELKALEDAREAEKCKNFFYRKKKGFCIAFKNLRRKLRRKYFPYKFKINKQRRLAQAEMLSKYRPSCLLEDRTRYFSEMLREDYNKRKQFYKFVGYFVNIDKADKVISTSDLFDYPILLGDSFTLLPHIQPVRCLANDPFYLEPLKRIDYGVFNYSQIKAPELISFGNPWI